MVHTWYMVHEQMVHEGVSSEALFLYIYRKTCTYARKNEEILHFFYKKFGHVKKKQYLCAIFRVNVRRIPENWKK